MAFRNWFKGKDFKKKEEEIKVVEVEVEEAFEKVQINVDGTYKFTVHAPDSYSNFRGYYIKISYNVSVDFGDVFKSQRINACVSVHPNQRLCEIEAYEYLSSYLGGTLVEHEKEKINEALEDDIIYQLNKLIRDKRLVEAKKLIDKDFKLNISFQANKTENGYFI